MSVFFNTHSIHLAKSEIIRYMGMPSSALTPSLDKLIDQSVSAMKATLRPRYVFRTFPKGDSTNGVLLEGSNIILQGENIKSHLKGAEKVVVLACTLGVEAERFIREASATDLTNAIILDAIATEFIEKVCDKLEEIIMAEYSPLGYTSNFRFGPGYGDLPLDVQPKILAALNAQKQIALYCNENNIMIPSKSVTGIFGLFKENNVTEKLAACSICQFENSCDKKEGDQRCGYKN